jgi:ABC-type glutathione transport system ATPase component
MSDILLNVRDLAIARRASDTCLVQGVNYTLRAGRVLGIVGESGSGKTLTCRALLGILPEALRIVRGSVALQGRDIAGFTRSDWNAVRGSSIAAVFQDPGSYLNPAIRVGKQLEELLIVKKRLSRRAAKRDVLQLLASVKLRDPEYVFEQYRHELSGGMLQRVLIAAALALEPQLLIADEATTALDVTVQAEILDLLLERKERTGLALLVVSHDLALVAQLCDEVLVMKAGVVVEQGPVAEVMRRPRHAYTQGLIAEHEAYGLERFLSAVVDRVG